MSDTQNQTVPWRSSQPALTAVNTEDLATDLNISLVDGDGKPLSKNELKRRIKQAQKQKKKEERYYINYLKNNKNKC